MKKPELLAPAGNMESLKAAVLAGSDAVYLGGYKFGARTFAKNFNNEEIIEAINYAHLYGVKIYVAVNTLIYENEVSEFMDYVDFLYRNNIDALIIQDIGMLDLVRKTYPKLELHASTQMHIHNLEGVKFVESLGVKKCVIARETDFLTIKNIKENTDIELEVFVHGALCISYSGECLMSSLIGGRSGNRGSCAGSCRLKYDFIHDGKKLNKDEYLLSTKDLNSLENVGTLIDIGVDSFKLEGRMKSPSYVYMVTSLYRKAIDSYLKTGKVNITKEEIKNLKKIFNRLFIKGFLFNEENDNFINPFRPNHLGIEIGKVINVNKNNALIKLSDELNINDGIRFLGEKDTGLILTSMFKNGKKVTNAYKNDVISIKVKEAVKKGSTVLKTTDYLLNKKIENELKNSFRKVLIDGEINLCIGKPMNLVVNDGINKVSVYGGIVEKSKTAPISLDKIQEQLSKLGSTVYELENLKVNKDKDIFVSIKELNELRREAINILNEKRLAKKEYVKKDYYIKVPDFKKERIYTILVNNKEQYTKIKDEDFKIIYIDNLDLYERINDKRKVLKLDRVINNYKNYDYPLLIGELGSINYYNDIISDFSLNVVNSYSVAFLHSLNVKRVTLSYELNDSQIEELINSYYKRYNKNPNLELIVYSKEEIMVSKFNLNKYFKVDGCSYLRDRFNNFYPIIIKNDLMYIYNYKYRNLTNHNEYFKMGVNSLRFNIFDNKDI